MNMSKADVTIVGAGVAGLTLGYQLARAGRRVRVIESAEQVGGLARTSQYDGFTFDTGPHRFYTNDQRVTDFILGVLGDQALTISMSSGVLFLGRYYRWPLGLETVTKLPPLIMLRAAFDLVHRCKREGQSFKDYILNRYGPTLYELDFGPYTEKFLGLDPAEIHQDWAKAGINRAVIDEKINISSLSQVIKTTFQRKKPLTLLYPRDGISVFSEHLREGIESTGGEVHVGAAVTGLDHTGDRIDSVCFNGRAVAVDQLVWTAPITHLARLLGLPTADLDFLSSVLCYVRLRGEPPLPYQWCYFVDADVCISRIYIPNLLSPSHAPQGKYGICAEVTCRQGDACWRRPDQVARQVIDDLLRTGQIRREDDVEGVSTQLLPDTYPVYHLRYREELGEVCGRLSRFRNLGLSGRSGLYWYNNMDHSIHNALAVSQHLLNGGQPCELTRSDVCF